MGLYVLGHLLHRVGYEQQLHVFGAYTFILRHNPYVFTEFFMVFGPENDHRKILDHLGLYQGNGFKKLIQCAHASGHNHKGIGVFDQQELSHKKIPNIDPFVEISVRFLFKGQNYIAAYRIPSRFISPFIGGFHNSGTPSCHHRKSHIGQCRSNLFCLFIKRIGIVKSGGPKYRYTGTYKVHFPKCPDKTVLYPKGEKQFFKPGARSGKKTRLFWL